jgi:hypothetical protein
MVMPNLRRNFNPQRDKAVELLQHYFALAMGKRSAAELNSDYQTEITEIVDAIIDAAVVEQKGCAE